MDVDELLDDPEFMDDALEYAAGLLPPFESLEDLVTSADGFGLVTATNLQRAICRVIEGRPLGDLADDPDVVEALGGGTPLEGQPLEVLIIAAVRCAKSQIAAAVGIWCARNVDVTAATGDGDLPRFSIASLELDNAKQVLAHLLGAARKPRVASMVVDVHEDTDDGAKLIRETGSKVLGSVFIRNKSGLPVEIRVVAGKRAGGSAVSRWSAGMVLDEAPRMVGASDGVVNYPDMRSAVISRLLPGAVLLSIGSPWAPRGPVYEVVQKEFGKPSRDRVIFKARGPQMNPYWWTAKRCERLKRLDPIAYKTDVLAEFADEEDQLVPQEVLREIACIRGDLPFRRGQEYTAMMDPATRRNAWTLVVLTREATGPDVSKVRVALAREWQGTPLEPLRPRAILAEVRDEVAAFGLDRVRTDQWSADSNADHATELGFYLDIEDWTAGEMTKAFLDFRDRAADGLIEVTDDPFVRKDILAVKTRPVGDSVRVVLPKTPDGRHCDYAAAIVRGAKEWLAEPEEIPPEQGTPEHEDYMDRMREEEEALAIEAAQSSPWWAE